MADCLALGLESILYLLTKMIIRLNMRFFCKVYLHGDQFSNIFNESLTGVSLVEAAYVRGWVSAIFFKFIRLDPVTAHLRTPFSRTKDLEFAGAQKKGHDSCCEQASENA